MFERGEKRRWRTTQPIDWEVGRQGSDDWVTIEPGREFESSVPFWAVCFLHPDDPRFLLAALVHDYMLESGRYGRVQAAAEWFDGALAGQAPRWKAKIAYVGVAAYAAFKRGAYTK